MSQLKKSNIVNYISSRVDILGENLDGVVFINGNSFGFTVATFDVDSQFSEESATIRALKDTDMNSIIKIISKFFSEDITGSCDDDVTRQDYYDADDVSLDYNKGQIIESVLITKGKNCTCSWVEFFIEPNQPVELAYHASLDDCIEHMIVYFVPSRCY